MALFFAANTTILTSAVNILFSSAKTTLSLAASNLLVFVFIYNHRNECCSLLHQCDTEEYKKINQ